MLTFPVFIIFYKTVAICIHQLSFPYHKYQAPAALSTLKDTNKSLGSVFE